jgi:hypothetical protein
VSQAAATKTDATGMATTEKMRAALTKVQQLMANMTLDQKLGYRSLLHDRTAVRGRLPVSARQ